MTTRQSSISSHAKTGSLFGDLAASARWRARLLVNTRAPWLRHLYIYLTNQKRLPNVVRPIRLNDIILKRMLGPQHPLVCETSCKRRAKDYIRARVGAAHVVPDFGAYARAEDIPWADFEYPIVAKPTNGSGRVLHFDSADDVRDQHIEKMRGWVQYGQFELAAATQYRGAPKEIIIEKRLTPVAPSEDLEDFKIHCFQGQPAFINVFCGRNIDRFQQAIYTPEWTRVPVCFGKAPAAPDIPKPTRLADMLDVAARVSDPFKYVRIDMYAVGDRLYVGELTHSPGACWDVFSIPAYEYWAGAPYYAPSDKERI